MAEASQDARKEWMSLLAKADAGALQSAFDGLGTPPDFTWLRPPEIGAIMVRGRQGGAGAPFNLGEMTVTRCTLRLEDGTVGHAYVPGRDAGQAQTAALCDALMQGAAADEVETKVLNPLRHAAKEARRVIAAKADATKVDFFTMVRGEV
jgi:alpha-D-ribose 1-methylphosphonate 5-triphosphate synthase subunit PhnG